jgi:hypothetical protein
MSRTLPLLLALLLASCSTESRTALRLTVWFEQALGLDQLRVSAQAAEADALTRTVPDPASPLSAGLTLVLLLPDEWADHSVRVRVSGLGGGKELAAGEVSATPRRAEVVEAELQLCASASQCSPGETQCVGEQVRVCEPRGGCPRWSPPAACPADKPFCSSGLCAKSCANECSAVGQRRCQGAGVQSCEQSATSSCLRWGPVVACGSQETCRAADGQCVLDCGGKPCPCTPGETKPCTDVGECRDGARRCVAGELGACEWKLGPQPELCDGKDNDCNGKTDDGLVAPGCEKQSGVCAGAVKACGGASGWLACGDKEYQAAAQQLGVTYQAVEALCDGKDNDCNGATDEAAGCSCKPACGGKVCGADDGCGYPCHTGVCSGPQDLCQGGKCVCQPSCASKACGADDGCGGKCSTGSCPANAVCQAGVCQCQGQSCGASCCAAGQVCNAGACCTPSCGSAVCGPDPVCGSSCGSCPAPASPNLVMSCVAGQCEADCKPGLSLCKGTCAGGGSCSFSDLQVASGSGVGGRADLDIDSAGVAHLAYTSSSYLYYGSVTGSTPKTENVEGYYYCKGQYNGAYVAVAAAPSKAYVACDHTISVKSNLRLFTWDGGTQKWKATTVLAQSDNLPEVADLDFVDDRLAFSIWKTIYNSPGFQTFYYAEAKSGWAASYLEGLTQNARPLSFFKGQGGEPRIGYAKNSASTLRLATKGSSSWTFQDIAGAPQDLALRADPQGKLCGVRAAYSASIVDLYFHQQATGWLPEAIVTGLAKPPSPSFLVDASGLPHLAFIDATGVKLATRLKGKWQIVPVSSLLPTTVRIAVDPTTGKIAIASAKSSEGVWLSR